MALRIPDSEGKTKDCSDKDPLTREAIGCGVSCKCSKLQNGLLYLDQYMNLLNLYRDSQIDLNFLTDREWAIIQEMLKQEQYVKAEHEIHIKQIERIFGKSK